MSSEQPSEPTVRKSALSPAMWRVLIAVGVLVVIGIGVAIWLLTAPARDAANGDAATPRPTTTQGPVPDATPTEGSEVLPPTETEPNRLPTITPAAPLIAPPLPASASGEGTLVAGFPEAVMGPMAGSELVQNSIATQDTTMQVTLVARSAASQKEIIAHYSDLWASLGLSPQPANADGSVGYSSAFESLSLAFTPASGTGTVYMIYGVFRTS